MMKKIFCFGELLLRMSPDSDRSWLHNAVMPVYIGGAELNVATALANWDLPAMYCTALPDNYLAKKIARELQGRKLEISPVIFSGNRIGIYYVAQGTDLKNAGLIYDREHSSFSELKTGMIDWDEMLKDCSWFHFSAISPALNENIAGVCKEALEAASKKKLIISVDLNYRSKLWKYGKKPVEVMPELVSYCSVVMGNIWSAGELLGINVDSESPGRRSKSVYLELAGATADTIMKTYPQSEVVANTFRFDEKEGIGYYATLDSKDGQYVSQEFFTNPVIDRVGTGDCFMAGLIRGLYLGHPHTDTVNFAASAASGKLQEAGDATKQVIAQIESRIKQHA